jgi:hypothetical protein
VCQNNQNPRMLDLIYLNNYLVFYFDMIQACYFIIFQNLFKTLIVQFYGSNENMKFLFVLDMLDAIDL